MASSFRKEVTDQIEAMKDSIDVMEQATECLIDKIDAMMSMIDLMMSIIQDDETAGDDWKPPGWKPGEEE